jgi:hypothetical protein
VCLHAWVSITVYLQVFEPLCVAVGMSICECVVGLAVC